MMKKFFSAAVVTAALAAIAYAAKRAVDENGGVKPAYNKARDGATSMLSQAKQSVADAFATARDRMTGNDNDFTGAPAGDLAIEQPIVKAGDTKPLMLAGAPAPEPEVTAVKDAAAA